jgi:hypothetical protein
MPALDYLFFAADLLNLKKLGHELVTIRITDSDDEHWYPVGLCPMLNKAQRTVVPSQTFLRSPADSTPEPRNIITRFDETRILGKEYKQATRASRRLPSLNSRTGMVT